MNILMIINPVSGDVNKAAILRQVKHALAPNDSLDTYQTTGKNDLEAIQEQLQQKKYERILVCGGDGTVKLIAEALAGDAVSIGVLPAGSANGLASDLAIPEEPEDYIPIALGSQIQTIDAISINNQLGLHISDFGLNAELVKEFESSTFRGILGYAINSIPTLFQSEGPYEFTIEADGKTYQRSAIMLAFANSKKFGTGAIVNPQGKIDDGQFELLIFKKLDLVEIIKTLQENTRLSSDFVEIIPVKHAKVTTQRPVDFQIDGEYCKAIQEVEAKILPQHLHLVTGK